MRNRQIPLTIGLIFVVFSLLYMLACRQPQPNPDPGPPPPGDTTSGPGPHVDSARASLIRKSINVVAAGKARSIGFYFFRPKGYNLKKKPVIIFMHGIGERGFNGTTGTDVNTVRTVLRQPIPKHLPTGTMEFINLTDHQKDGFIVLAPQCSTEFSSWPTFYVEEMLKYVKRSLLDIADTNRIYLTGLSLGGGGVWDCLEVDAIAKQIAAAAPVCGTCRLSSATAIVKNNVPIWIFHANDDPTVGVSCSNNAYLTIVKANPTHDIQKTIYASGGHGIWNRAYDTLNRSYVLVGNILEKQEPNLYQWFLQYEKNPRRGWNEWEEPQPEQ